MEAFRNRWNGAGLYLDGDGSTTGAFENQIDLGAGRGSIKTGYRAAREHGDQILDNEALPAGASDEVARERVVVANAQKLMQQPGVPD
ncbi:MAG TPA: hypothetical protein VIF02_05365 [Methylocella sp.]|jgi:hypothetical protein